MMRMLKAIGIAVAALALTGIAIRMLTPLPSLAGRATSRAVPGIQTALGRSLAPQVAAHPGQSGFYLLPDGRDAFAARVLLARAAQRTIDAQYYIWHGDLTGMFLFGELRKAADRGVRVRLLIDDNNTAGLDDLLAGLDAHPRIEVRLFNPFTVRRPRLVGWAVDFNRLNRRMHNKSFTVDGAATVIGGRNVGDEYFGAGSGALFVDLDALAVGPVAGAVSNDFDRYWASASAYPAGSVLPSSAYQHPRDVRRAGSPSPATTPPPLILDTVRSLPIVSDLSARRLPLEWAPVSLISDDPAKALGKGIRTIW